RELYETGPSLTGRGFVVERVHYAAGYRREPHSHETLGITLVLDGHLRERVRGVEEDSSALSVVVKPAGTVHENEVGPRGACTIAVTILDSEALLDDARDLGTWRWSHPGTGVQPLLALGRALVQPSSATDPEEMVHELLGEVTGAPATRPGDAPSWIRRARETLDDLGPEGIEVRALADSLRVHPVSLTRAFRRAYGIPVTRYRRLVRLRRAAEQLAGTEQSLSAVAQLAGYADQPHMCREIRSLTGLAPAVFRALARG
ncbi:MAG TPA: AraC family transcriptional regulator, partial [Thermoanaerobaculia bacterium]|nr:AraC family transcriptional regulator [Thermoanaerobaculia bacterium]